MIYAFVIFTVGFVLCIEIFTILFQLTGLSKHKARFQVISILTGTGFTTKESELITRSKIRRTIAQIIMIFGFTCSATIVTILFSFVRSYQDFTYGDLAFVVISLVVIYVIGSVTNAGELFDKTIEAVATRALFGKNTNVIVTKDSYDNDVVIAEVVIKVMPQELEGKKLEDTNVSRQGIMILAIEREQGVITNVTKDTILQKNDTITIFGPRKSINNMFIDKQKS